MERGVVGLDEEERRRELGQGRLGRRALLRGVGRRVGLGAEGRGRGGGRGLGLAELLGLVRGARGLGRLRGRARRGRRRVPRGGGGLARGVEGQRERLGDEEPPLADLGLAAPELRADAALDAVPAEPLAAERQLALAVLLLGLALELAPLRGLGLLAREPGQEKGAKFPTSKAPISVVSRSFRLILGRAIISRSALEAWVLFPKRVCAEHSR